MEELKNKFRNWANSKRRIVNFVIGINSVLLYEATRAYYRPFIYSHSINDFHIADTLGNSLGTIATVFVFASILGRDIAYEYFLIRTVAISVFVYELAHPLLGKPIDPWDMVATVFAGIFCEVLYRLLHGQLPNTIHKNNITP